MFVHLHTHSHYSLLDGLAKIDDLVNEAVKYDMTALALTDHGNMYGAIEFYKKARIAGIKPILGVEIYIAKRNIEDKQAGIDDKRYHLVLLAENNEGYQNLLKLVSISNLEGFYYKPRLDKKTLKKYSKGIIALSACMSGEIPRALLMKDFAKAEELLKEYQEIFGKENFFIELESHPNILNHNDVQKELLNLARKFNAPIVAANDIHYLKKEDSAYQEILLAVQTNSRVDDEDRLTMKEDNFSFRSSEEMKELFFGAPDAIENSVKIAERCNVNLNLGEIKFPYFEIPEGFNQLSYFKYLAERGFKEKFGENPNEEAKKRFEFELGVIEKTGFINYFLIVQDFVNFARLAGIFVGPGRGSAAGSLISYVLGITNINPLKYDLLFERFLNPERISPPDIDLDFADTRRDEVINYISKKYGTDKVAQIITFGTMAARAAIRDAGRALGMSYIFCDEIAKMIPFQYNLEKSLAEINKFKDIYNENLEARKLIDAARKLEGVVRHASTHACGIVISEKPLIDYLPLQLSTSNNSEEKKSVVTQYEMHAIEDLGLLKMDILGLKNLSVMESALNLIKLYLFRDLDLYNLILNDSQVFKTIADGKTVGIFQLEGGGMTKYIKELKPTNINDIIAMIALYRPGPMDLIPSYIDRKQGKEPIKYLHKNLAPILKNTYGIMIYQEQLMQAAQALAGFTLGEADILRKAVGKKIKKMLSEQKEKIISGTEKITGSKNLGEKFWELIEPFGSYGFNKSHAAAYAIIAYQTAYLKTYYPLFLISALMDADNKDIDRISFLVKECQNLDIKVLGPDINLSDENFTPQFEIDESNKITGIKNCAIRFGLRAVKNVGKNIVKSIIEERKKGGAYLSFADFIERVPSKDLNKKSMEALIKSGATDGLGERNTFLFNLEKSLDYHKEIKNTSEHSQASLFSLVQDKSSLPSLKLIKSEPADFDTKLKWEKELLGLYISGHPLNKYEKKLAKSKMNISHLKSMADGTPVLIAGLVAEIKKILTKKNEPMLFVKIMDFTGEIEAVIFPRILTSFGKFIKEDGCVVMKGKISLRNNTTNIIVNEIKEI